MDGTFPIYIPSKSRADSRMTMRALDRTGMQYTVVVEDQEYDEYAAVLPDARLLVLDKRHQDEYDPFDKLGMSKPLGSGPARNAAWADSIERGATWHWIMDDNIEAFYWLWHNQLVRADDAAPFVAMENFATRYRNVAMAGPNYLMFAKRRQKLAPFVTGTRLYSCILIRNAVQQRWRGRWNEDVDLSLRLLKAGWNTVQFNAYLQNKVRTQSLKGGNTENYQRYGTAEKSAMLVAMHPDCTKLLHRFGRVHHYVSYDQWRKQPLLVDPNAPPPQQWTTKLITSAGSLDGETVAPPTTGAGSTPARRSRTKINA